MHISAQGWLRARPPTSQLPACLPAAPRPLSPPAQIIGRLAPQIGRLLMGKHKPTFLPHVDCGDWVVVTNARHAVFTGDKMRSKLYKWHTQFAGGLKTLTARQLHERAPERLLEIAVQGMLAPNNLRATRMRRLRVFAEAEHGHTRQTGESLRYAPAYMRASAPRSFSPPPKAVTGALVTDVFPGVRGRAELELAAAALRVEAPEAALAAMDAELARLAAERRAAKPLA